MNLESKIFLLLFILIISSCKKDPAPVPSPPDVDAESYTFAVIGDFGYNGDNPLKVSKLVKSWDPDFILTVGDNNYSDGALSTIEENISQYYSDFIYNPDAPSDLQCTGKAAAEKQNQFFPCLGNHDQKSSESYLPYLSFFTLPGEEVYYDFKWGPVHFFAINSGKDTDHDCCDSEQAIWLKQQLAQSTKTFKIVFFHHAPYSTSKYGEIEEMQWPFQEWGANAVLSGHNHVYQRVLKKESPTFPYFINGLGGKSIHDCDINPLDPAVFESTCFNDDFGAMRCEVSTDKIVLQFISLEEPDKAVDEFVIRK